MAYEEIIENYLRLCRNACNLGGYTRLSCSEGDIIDSVSQRFAGNGYKEEKVSQVIKICQEEMFKSLKVGRHFGWPDYLEKEMKRGINTALREV